MKAAFTLPLLLISLSAASQTTPVQPPAPKCYALFQNMAAGLVSPPVEMSGEAMPDGRSFRLDAVIRGIPFIATIVDNDVQVKIVLEPEDRYGATVEVNSGGSFNQKGIFETSYQKGGSTMMPAVLYGVTCTK